MLVATGGPNRVPVVRGQFCYCGIPGGFILSGITSRRGLRSG